MRRIIITIAALAIGAATPASAQRLFGPGLFVSPAGEPFRPASGPGPIEAWFLGADADRDGALTRDEFRADFARFFATLDSDGDGEIEPTEVSRYELEVLPEMREGGPRGNRFQPGIRGAMQRDRAARRGGSRPVGSTVMMAGAARFGLLPISHPIMEADTDFNGGVSRDEFASAALRRFGRLDAASAGRLTLEELRAHRPGRGRRPG